MLVAHLSKVPTAPYNQVKKVNPLHGYVRSMGSRNGERVWSC